MSKSEQTTKHIKLDWTTNTQVSELSNPELDNIELVELELRHEQKLYAIQQTYFDSLKEQKTDISAKLKTQISDYSCELLTHHLREIEDETIGFQLDNSKIQKLNSELELLNEKANDKQRFTGEVKVLKII